ncbi:putative hetero-Diels-Alderase [Pseudocercospora fuligena]|uniref:Putative hetero-Diels-Alderase n=1 Tax=Pseudocercospora fuligena TaxID=685502 RepID=A0A8H6RRZ7_9PEZI|nr:putative hetero-Diels-Alderase [Pseudocercospora fuligena]
MNTFSLMLTFLLGVVHCLPKTKTLSTYDISRPSKDHRVRDLQVFQVGTWVENLYVRPNGRILATIYTPFPGIYEIDPHSEQAALVAILPGIANVLGIAEGRTPSTIYAIGEDFPVTTLKGVRGSNSIYEVDLRKFDATRGRQKADVKIALNVSNATALNGLAPVDAAKGLYVSTDFDAGSIYLLNLVTGAASIIVSNEWTAHLPGSAGGADGIKVRDGYIYWTSFSANVFARIPIDEAGMPTGEAEKLADVFSDDFCFGWTDEVYLTMPEQNAIGIWKPGQRSVLPLPGSVFGSTAVQLGSDGRSLVVTTSGNDTQYPDNITRPGKVVELRL